MTTCIMATEAQRTIAKPWAISILSLWIAALLSYMGLGLYMLLSPECNPVVIGVWVMATLIARRLGPEVCVRKLQKNAGEKQSGWASFAVWLVLIAGFGVMVLW